MDIKYILGALILILLVGNIYCIYEMQFSNQSEGSIIIGNKVVQLPDNYYSNKIEVSNGNNTLTILKLGNIDMDVAIDKYNNQSSGEFNVSISEFDSKLPSKKTVATNYYNSSFIKYWFEVDGTLYQMQFSSNKNSDINLCDDGARNIINSIP